MTLRTKLANAVKSRDRIVKLSKGRTDWTFVRTSIALCEQFLINHPTATDERVREWCKAHHRYIWAVTTSGTRRVYAELTGA